MQNRGKYPQWSKGHTIALKLLILFLNCFLCFFLCLAPWLAYLICLAPHSVPKLVVWHMPPARKSAFIMVFLGGGGCIYRNKSNWNCFCNISQKNPKYKLLFWNNHNCKHLFLSFPPTLRKSCSLVPNSFNGGVGFQGKCEKSIDC